MTTQTTTADYRHFRPQGKGLGKRESTLISTRVPHDLANAIRAEAARYDLTPGQFIRELVASRVASAERGGG